MLSKKYRLSKEKDISDVFKRGKIYFSPFFNLKLAKNNQNVPRFCIVVSTKISKKAVERNRLKRQLKAIIFKNLANFSPNYDYIILTKPAALAVKYIDLEENFKLLIKNP